MFDESLAYFLETVLRGVPIAGASQFIHTYVLTTHQEGSSRAPRVWTSTDILQIYGNVGFIALANTENWRRQGGSVPRESLEEATIKQSCIKHNHITDLITNLETKSVSLISSPITKTVAAEFYHCSKSVQDNYRRAHGRP